MSSDPMEAGSESPARGVLAEAKSIDEAVYRAVAGEDTPSLDHWLRLLSTAANESVLWLAVAGALAAVGGRRGRRAAVVGLASIGVTSAAVNLGMKHLHRRPRPDRGEAVADRHVAMPASSSFPSGHSASAFAFASAVSVELPVLAFPMRVLAGAVAYSRVHTGVHYPGDALAGALLGAATGQMVARGVESLRQGWSARKPRR
jgi:undecaprenyl-diphosphatase